MKWNYLLLFDNITHMATLHIERTYSFLMLLRMKFKISLFSLSDKTIEAKIKVTATLNKM